MKKLRRAAGRREDSEVVRKEKHVPTYKLDHIVRERCAAAVLGALWAVSCSLGRGELAAAQVPDVRGRAARPG